MRDKLPSRVWKNESGIVNLDRASGKGTHWVAYKRRGGVTKYFDSYGALPPPKELIRYLKGDIVYNEKRYQKSNESNCGHLSLAFLIS